MAHWWSPDSSYICFAQFDDSSVPLYRFPHYGEGTNIYGDMQKIAYPKAGDTKKNINPRVTLYVMETANTAIAHKRLTPPLEVAYK